MKKIIIFMCAFAMLFIVSGCVVSSLEPSQFQSTKKSCEQGNGDKCYVLGRMYKEGIGTEKSDSKAKNAFRLGCQADNQNACSELRKMQVRERGENGVTEKSIEQNQTTSVLLPSQFETYKNACHQGDGDKCYSLGRMYMQGIGTGKSVRSAKDAYTKGCEKSSDTTLDSCYALGKIFVDGKEVGQNYGKAKMLFEHTCRKEFTKGCSDLGYMYYYGKGVEQNYVEAKRLLEQGCKTNDAKACSTLGTLYITGQGVNEDYNKAYEAFDKACQLGDALGCYNIGNIYENGIGRAQSRNDAIEFYRLSCSMGLREGCQSLKLLQVDVR